MITREKEKTIGRRAEKKNKMTSYICIRSLLQYVQECINTIERQCVLFKIITYKKKRSLSEPYANVKLV